MFSTIANRMIATIILVFVLASTANAGSVIFVDDDAPPGGDGLSWDTAYRFLQDGLSHASGSALALGGGGVSEIHVAQGTYKPDRSEANPKGTGDREATFNLVSGISLMGGYAGIGAKDPDTRDIELYETIMSGEIGNSQDPDDNIAHVFTAIDVNSGTILDGVSVTRGSSYINELPLEQAVGGGLYIISGSPIVRAVTFHNNRSPAGQNFAGGRGAGAHVETGSPVFEDCDFVSNYAEEGGAGLSSFGNPTLNRCTFVNNFNEANNSTTGGAFQTEAGMANLFDCHFIENASDSKAGGLRSAETDLVLVRCSFVNNTSGGSGSPGADIRYGSAVIISCEFIGNIGSSGSAGGGLFLESQGASLINCLFQENSAGNGGALLTQANVFITNCIFDSNVGDRGGAIEASGWAVKITNSVFFNNFGDDKGGAIFARSEPLTITNCVIVNNSSPGVGDGIWVDTGQTLITNSILWSNGSATETSQIFINEFAIASVDYSVVQGLTGNLGGVGNLGDNPMFVDQNVGDLHLLPGSPCIDAANNIVVPPDEFDLDGDEDTKEPIPFDLDGNPRFVNIPNTPDTGNGKAPIVDMGAYEFQLVLDMDIKPGSCPNPLNTKSHGMMPAAILGTKNFDTSLIDIASLTIARADGIGGSVAPNEGPPGPHSTFDDVGTPFGDELCDCHELDGDGITDLAMHFSTPQMVEAMQLGNLPSSSQVELVISGLLIDETPFMAIDCIELVPPGDMDGDGAVTVLDMIILFNNWGYCNTCIDCPADLDGDCAISISDLLILLSDWN